METLVAPETVQARVELCPGAMAPGVAVKDEMVGSGTEVTVTVAVAVALPAAFVAVSTYVVVPDGVTERFVPVTAPMPGSMETLVASDTVQARVELCPGAMAPGVAVKEEMVGSGAAATVTVAVAVALPPALVAVSV
jgi:hypothetical protein